MRPVERGKRVVGGIHITGAFHIPFSIVEAFEEIDSRNLIAELSHLDYECRLCREAEGKDRSHDAPQSDRARYRRTA